MNLVSRAFEVACGSQLAEQDMTAVSRHWSPSRCWYWVRIILQQTHRR